LKKYFCFWWNAVLQIFLIALNLCEAAFHSYKHHWRLVPWSLAVAGFLVGINFLGYKLRMKQLQLMAELQARHAEMIQVLEARVMGPEAMTKAEENLALVVKALDVEVQGSCYFLKVKKQFFRISARAIYECSPSYQAIQGTCMQHGGLPIPEAIATMLLLLKNDPGIFHKWRNDAGTNYGA